MTLRRFGVFGAASSLAIGLVSLHAAPARAQSVSPHLSMTTLTSSNGLGALVYDATAYKITEFLEHPYQASNSTTTSRNFAYDSYPGIRVGAVGTAGTWFTGITPSVIEYLPGTGIIHTQRSLQGLTIDEYDFEPMALAENASVMMVKVTQTGTAGPVDVFSLFNYNVGTGNPPASTNELTSYDSTYDAYYEYSNGVGVTMAFGSLTASSFHACGAAGASTNPYAVLTAGGNLGDDTGTGTTAVTGATEGFQSSLGTLASGASAWAAWVTVLAPDANNAQAAIITAQDWFTAQGGTPAAVLAAEQSAWAAWVTAPPSGASATEAALEQQSQVILRMGQVVETGQGDGQVLASLTDTPPPALTFGNWNISWVRDMAYATVGLVKSGHYTEAKAALAYYLQANVGAYESYLTGDYGDAGVPYQISVCRYYGGGTEWSDSNSNGPNIEFDGFGLFLWALDEYVAASGDTSLITTYWASTIKPKVADVLVHLQDPNGLISADSSIWEVHWDGQQRHFTYTTAAAANGLCSASRVATLAGDTASSTTYLTQGQMARDALVGYLRGPGGALGQSTEAIASGSAWLDASVIEAINWGLIDPTGPTAQATMNAMKTNLLVADGEGFMRDQTGGSYDSQEWVFVDLRSARAFALGGSGTFSTNLFAWNTQQSADNFGEISELYSPTTGDYEGSPPMVGFGAGAYILTLAERGTPVTPSCGAFAVEPGVSDGGAGGDAGGDGGGLTDGGGSPVDGGGADATVTSDGGGGVQDAAGGSEFDGNLPPVEGEGGTSSGGCGCFVTGRASTGGGWASLLVLTGLVAARRRKRRLSGTSSH
ncbi:MAG: glycoside hydrolase family 15 protein [Polyangiaceae bacterium]